MQKKYIAIIIVVTIVLGGLYLFYQSNIKNNSMSQKAYALYDATLDASNLEITHKNNPPGRSEILFVVDLGSNKYLVTKFSWPVVQNPNPEQLPGSTYILENGNFTPSTATFKFTPSTGVLEGEVLGQSLSVNKDNTNTVVNAGEFEQVKNLSGWEKAVYKE